MQHGKKMRVVIAEDHTAVTQTIAMLVRKKLTEPTDSLQFVVNGDDLLDQMRSDQPPDIVVLDLEMPGEFKRIALIHAVKAANADVRLLCYSAHDHSNIVFAAMQGGVKGYVTKARKMRDFEEALEVVMGGGEYLDPTVDLYSAARHPWRTLSPAERFVLLAQVQGKRAKEIARDSGKSLSTVSGQTYSGLRKLGLRGAKDLTKYLFDNGLQYELDEQSRETTSW